LKRGTCFNFIALNDAVKRFAFLNLKCHQKYMRAHPGKLVGAVSVSNCVGLGLKPPLQTAVLFNEAVLTPLGRNFKKLAPSAQINRVVLHADMRNELFLGAAADFSRESFCSCANDFWPMFDTTRDDP
jgi:hypothetical protein